MQSYDYIKCVFLADDDLDDRDLFVEAVREVNSEVSITLFEDGVKLMDALYSGFQPQILFLDLNMPRKSGMQCLEEIRNDNRFKDIRILVFSTSTDEHAIKDAYEKGADLYIEKPSTYCGLRAIVKQFLGGEGCEPILTNRKDFLFRTSRSNSGRRLF